MFGLSCIIYFSNFYVSIFVLFRKMFSCVNFTALLSGPNTKAGSTVQSGRTVHKTDTLAVRLLLKTLGLIADEKRQYGE